MKENKAEKERIWSTILKRSVHIKDYDAEYEHPTKCTSGRASYVERNQAMINDSDFFVFYFDETYKPPRRKYGKSYLTDYQPESGTAVAYAYRKSSPKNKKMPKRRLYQAGSDSSCQAMPCRRKRQYITFCKNNKFFEMKVYSTVDPCFFHRYYRGWGVHDVIQKDTALGTLK